MRSLLFLVVASSVVWLSANGTLQAQTSEEETVRAAGQALSEIMAIPAKGIPASMLKDAYGVAIVPGMVKGGFIIGVRHGNGVVVTKDRNGRWQLPFFITITGGSIGWQAGLQATDVILVFKSQKSVDGLMRGRFTIGADAAVAAGPVGRQATAATDAQLKAEILSYSRSRGLFAGVSIDGAAMQMDHRATNAYYAALPGQPQRQIPESAVKLTDMIAKLTQSAQVVQNPPVIPNPNPNNPPVVVNNAEAQLRMQLIESSRQLQALVDPQWQKYLSLPAGLYNGPLPSAQELTPFLNRYNTVAADPRYRALTERREFQQTHTLLRQLVNQETAPNPGLQIPPPPGQ